MNVLYLAHRYPDAPVKGDKIRSYHQIRALAANHDVHLFALDDEPDRKSKTPSWHDDMASTTVIPLRPTAARLRTLWAMASGRSLSAAHFAEPALVRALDEARSRHRFDVAVSFSGAIDPLLGGMRPRVLDLVDVDSAKFHAYRSEGAASGTKRWVFGLEGRRLQALETKAVEEADVTLLCTDAEAARLRTFAQPRRLEVLGNGVDLDAFPFSDEGRAEAELLFVGALDYQANVDAARILVREVLPVVQARRPDARVTLVGSRPASGVRELEGPSVTVAADVDSVVPYLHRATMTVLPFRVARGIQNKALEAFACGLPVVLSAETAKGIAGTPGRDYVVGPDAPALAEHVLRLCAQPGERAALAQHGRALVETRYSWDAALTRFCSLVEEAAQTSPGGVAT